MSTKPSRKGREAESLDSVWPNSLLILAILGLLGSVVWLLRDPGFEPLLLFFSQLSILIARYPIRHRKDAQKWDKIMTIFILVIFSIALTKLSGSSWVNINSPGLAVQIRNEGIMARFIIITISIISLFFGSVMIMVGFLVFSKKTISNTQESWRS